ncbi:MAG: hypothetical protein WCF67_17145 [Chitinophagaceae bacterium]
MKIPVSLVLLLWMFSYQFCIAQKGQSNRVTNGQWNLTAYKKNKCDSILLELLPRTQSLGQGTIHYTSYPSWEQLDVDNLSAQQSIAFGNGVSIYYPNRGTWLKPDFSLIFKDINENYIYLRDTISGSFFLISKSIDQLEEFKNKLKFFALRPSMTRSAKSTNQWYPIPARKISVSFGEISDKRTYRKWDGGNRELFEERLERVTKTKMAIERLSDGDLKTSTDPLINPGNFGRAGLRSGSFRQSSNSRPRAGYDRRKQNYKRLLQELTEEEGNARVSAIGATNSTTPCEPNQFPFYFMEVKFDYAPQLLDFQVKVVLDDVSILTGKEIASDNFKVSRFAISDFKEPRNKGEKECKVTVLDLQHGNSKDLIAEIVYSGAADRNKLSQINTFNQVSSSQMKISADDDTSSLQMFFPKNQYNFFNEDDRTMISNINSVNSNISDRNKIIFNSGEYVHMRLQLKNFGKLEFISKLITFKMPKPISIGIVGDSYSSGEGAPENDNSPWIGEVDACDCHRSNLSGHHLAVCQFVKENMNLDIQFKFLSCSGAKIENLMWDFRYSKGYISPQLPDLKRWMSSLSLDDLSVLIMSIGGNNTGFADAVAQAFLPPEQLIYPLGIYYFIPFLTKSDFEEKTNQRMDKLKTRYVELNNYLRDFINPKTIILSSYANPLSDPTGFVCYHDCPDNWETRSIIFDPMELTALSKFYDKLISTQRLMSDSLNWVYDEKVRELSLGHGFCNCEDSYFNGFFTLQNKAKCEVCTAQLGLECVAHPNAKGYRMTYKVATYERLINLPN